MEGNKSFTQEDTFTNELTCKEFIRNFNDTNNYYNDRILLATHDAAASLSPVQVDVNPLGPPATGTQADTGNLRDQPRPGQPPRRSRRLAGLTIENDGIT